MKIVKIILIPIVLMTGVILGFKYLHTPAKKWVGVVVSVSKWNGSAQLKTKTEVGVDTILTVTANRYQIFEVGQTMTAWSGGNLIGGAVSTIPQY